MTEVDATTAPVTVRRLHYEFEGWFGDCLVASDEVYVLEESAADELVARRFSGFDLRDAIISTSDVFDELLPDVVLPKFVWLDVTGVAGVDDLGLEPDGRLVVAANVLTVLRKHGIDNCGIERYIENPTDQDELLDRLFRSIQHLAWPADRQKMYLQVDLGVSALTDELALEFEDAYRAAAPLLEELGVPTQVRESLLTIEQLLQEMRATESDRLATWSLTGLDNLRSWAELRTLASDLLGAFPGAAAQE